MAMGMVAFVTVFTTAFVGMSVVWDRRLGFMNKVLSTPVSRSVIITIKSDFSKHSVNLPSSHRNSHRVLAGSPTGRKLHCLQRIRSLRNSVPHRLRLIIAVHSNLLYRTTRMETPQAIFNLVTLPLMFASSAYFPINLMPNWLKAIANANPISYTIDAVRRLMVFSDGYRTPAT